MNQPDDFPQLVFDVRAYGAVGDGQTLDTRAL
jgi:polygalacturonase